MRRAQAGQMDGNLGGNPTQVLGGAQLARHGTLPNCLYFPTNQERQDVTMITRRGDMAG